MPSIAQNPSPTISPILSKKRNWEDDVQIKLASHQAPRAFHDTDTFSAEENSCRPCIPLKRRRVALQDVVIEQLEQIEQSKFDLRPCHVCRRKPAGKREVREYVDCQGCMQRTCYVCVRLCEGVERRRDVDVEGDYDLLAKSFGSEEGEGDGDGGGVWEKGRMTEHRGKICRDCCVEVGEEGTVRCLGCYRVDGTG